ncbi:MAG: TetR/AcrR family transcriptional regulator [Clostridiaceae bacterium]
MGGLKLKWMQAGGPNPLDQSPALYEATLTEFSGHSFKDASLNEILKAAGMNKGSFYYRFNDKMELYLSLLYRVGMEKLKLFEESGVSRSSSGFFDEFRNMALLGLKLAKKDARFTAFSRRILEEESAVREQITACFGNLSGTLLTDMVERAKASGEFRKDLSTETAVFVIETLLNHMDALIPAAWDDASVLAAVDRLLEVVRSGVGAER